MTSGCCRSHVVNVSIDVWNLFDQKAVINFGDSPYRDQTMIPDAVYFAPGGFDLGAYVASVRTAAGDPQDSTRCAAIRSTRSLKAPRPIRAAGCSSSAPGIVSDGQRRGHRHEVGQRPGVHLAHHLGAMRLHGDLSDPQLRADLLVQQPGYRPTPAPGARAA